MKKRKVAIIGTGMVGMSYAYCLLNQFACDELVLINRNKERSVSEAMDMNHALAFTLSHMNIYSGDYKDCSDAEIVVICAGANQKAGESRIDLLQRNVKILDDAVIAVVKSGFQGIFVLASNPVDILARRTLEISGFPSNRVIGSGTLLDTARLKYIIGKHFSIAPQEVNGFVMGEHGATQFVPWSQVRIGPKPILEVCEEDCPYQKFALCVDDDNFLKLTEDMVREAVVFVISGKQATYYGIGMSLLRLTKAILSDQKAILPVSANLQGEYGQTDVYSGVPCVIGQNGIEKIVTLKITDEEQQKFQSSCDTLRAVYADIK